MSTRRITNQILIGMAVLSGAMFGAPAAHADEQQPGVARISLIHGDVSTQRGDSGDWAAVTVNTPVVAGDRISTGTKSRAEVQLDYANILRLDERADVKIAELGRTRIQLQVHEGLINFTVLKGSEADVEIDTSNVAVRPVAGEGSYRILVIQDETRVIVRKGEVEVTTPQGSTRVRNDQEITVRGTDTPEFRVSDAPGRDDWDNFNKDRDHQIRDAQSWNHTNRYYSGSEDLDRSGRWVDVPGYGDVWQPAVSADWAPYRDGRWVWEPYYGWTWVSYEPWGWAPYHYGRWFYYGSSWSWWPGPIERGFYPVWAPAYVSFFGFGRHFGVGIGFGFGSVGWLPLGPSDFCYPWWGGGRRNVTIVNVTNITNITNITNVHGGLRQISPLSTGNRPVISNLHGLVNNQRLQNGITAMPSERFGKSAVPKNFDHVTAALLRDGGVVAGSLPVVPTRESLRAVDRRVDRAALPRQTGAPEHYFAKTQPTSTPQPFHEQAAQMEQVVQQHQAAMQASRNSSSNPSAPNVTERNVGPAGRRVTNSPSVPVVGVNSKPAVPAPAPAPAPGSSADRQGWHRFGSPTTSPREQSSPQGRTETAAPSRPQGVTPAPSNPPRQSVPERSAPQPRETNRDSSRPPTPAPAPAATPKPPASEQSSGWQHFTPQPGSRSSVGGERSSPNRPPVMEHEQQRNWHPEASSSPTRSYEPPRNYAPPRNDSPPRSYSPPRSEPRPALDLHRDIVTPRSSSRSESGSGGGSPSGSSSGGRSSSSTSSSHGSSSKSSSRPPHR